MGSNPVPSSKHMYSHSSERMYAPRSRASGLRLSSSVRPAKTPQQPGMSVKAIMPEPRMAPGVGEIEGR